MQYFGVGRLSTVQSVAYTGTAGTVTNGFAVSTQKVRVVTTTDAFIKIDNSPTATTADTYLPALSAEYFTCTSGQKISAIQVAAGGTLYVTEIV